MMEEMLDIYTRDGKHIGTETKSACHSKNPDFYHKAAWIWIINDNNEVLIQKRASCKKNNPNKWDMSVAGHIRAGETSLEGAIRETYEEIGISPKEEDYEFICDYIYDETNEIAQIYLLRLNLNINDFKIKEDEVSEVKWFSYDEFKELFNSDEFVKFNEEYIKFILDLLKGELYVN